MMIRPRKLSSTRDVTGSTPSCVLFRNGYLEAGIDTGL